MYFGLVIVSESVNRKTLTIWCIAVTFQFSVLVNVENLNYTKKKKKCRQLLCTIFKIYLFSRDLPPSISLSWMSNLFFLYCSAIVCSYFKLTKTHLSKLILTKFVTKCTCAFQTPDIHPLNISRFILFLISLSNSPILKLIKVKL